MEPTASPAPPESTPKVTAADRELGLRLASVVVCSMNADGGAAIRALDESGITFIQMKALVTIAGDNPERPTVKTLADTVGLSLASASRAIEGLVKKGLVTRTEDDEDRRVRRLALTEAGEQLSHRILAARLEGLGRFVASLTEAQHAQLAGALDLLLERDDVAAIYKRYRKEARR
jgi:DNA-binding MarR family transcriptional regulator